MPGRNVLASVGFALTVTGPIILILALGPSLRGPA
jgi:hypothetical protein